MTRRGGDKCLASVRLVDALDESLLFKRLQRAIYSDQSKSRVSGTRFVIHFDGGEGMRAARHNLHDGAASLSKAIALFIQLDEPGMFTHICS